MEQIHRLEDRDKFVVARFLYKIGEPALTDLQYDMLKGVVMLDETLTDYLVRNYEDDPFPSAELKKMCDSEEEFQSYVKKEEEWLADGGLSTYVDVIQKYQGKSICSIETLTDAFNWFQQFEEGTEFVMSLKVDGFNVRSLYIDGVYATSVTRGRAATTPFELDFVKAGMLPKEIDTEEAEVVISHEAYVPLTELEDIQSFGVNYKTSRGAALAIMRTSTLSEQRKRVRIAAFKDSYHNYLEDSFRWLVEEDIDVAPYATVPKPSFNRIEEFEEWLHHNLNVMYEVGQALNIPSDGLVVEVNNQQDFNRLGENPMYNYGNIAVKIGPWASSVFRSKLIDLEIEQQRDRCSVVGVIEPVITPSGVEINRVNLFNLGILIEHGINVGDEIMFEYKSESNINLIYGRE